MSKDMLKVKKPVMEIGDRVWKQSPAKEAWEFEE